MNNINKKKKKNKLTFNLCNIINYLTNGAYFLIILLKHKEMSQNSYFITIYTHVYPQQWWILL